MITSNVRTQLSKQYHISRCKYATFPHFWVQLEGTGWVLFRTFKKEHFRWILWFSPFDRQGAHDLCRLLNRHTMSKPGQRNYCLLLFARCNIWVQVKVLSISANVNMLNLFMNRLKSPVIGTYLVVMPISHGDSTKLRNSRYVALSNGWKLYVAALLDRLGTPLAPVEALPSSISLPFVLASLFVIG